MTIPVKCVNSDLKANFTAGINLHRKVKKPITHIIYNYKNGNLRSLPLLDLVKSESAIDSVSTTLQHRYLFLATVDANIPKTKVKSSYNAISLHTFRNYSCPR